MYPEKQVFLVLGLSRSGKSATEFLLSKNATVYIYDDLTSERIEKTANLLEEKGARRVAKENLIKTPELCDVLVLSPGIPIDHPLAVAFKRKGRAVIGEMELASKYMHATLLAITGTNGKTTTVSILTDILKKGGYNAQACGNIGAPMTDFCGLDEKAVAVVEVSSFQLETLNSLCPHIAVVLNVSEDHLNRHYNMENYIFLKAKLLKNLTEAEYVVLNYDDETVRSFAERTKARVVWISAYEKVYGAYATKEGIYFGEEKIIDVEELVLEGVHNIQNALSAVAVAKLMGVQSSHIKEALGDFKGIKHRMETVCKTNGVTYINDSKGTNVDATLKAVRCMKEETLLLLGGKHKGYDYSKLFASLKNSKIIHCVLYGENRYALLKSAREQGYERVTVCENMSVAVRIASLLVVEGQTVLLSPASASFDEFAGYEERGEKFVETVQSLQRQEYGEESANEGKEISVIEESE